MAAATALPYLAAAWAAPEGYAYTWILPPYPVDAQAYMAWSRQAAEGAWLFKDKFTALPHEPFLFHPFFLLAGRLAAWTGQELGPVLLALKTAGVFGFWLAFRRLARTLEVPLWPAAFIAAFVTGLGGLCLQLLGVGALKRHVPIDIWVIDVDTLWSLAWNPLYPWVLALLCLFVERLERDRPWQAGAAAALAVLLHPYCAPLLILLVAGAALWRGAARPLLALLPLAPAAAYLLWASRQPVAARHSDMGAMLTPSWLAVLLGLAPLLALQRRPKPEHFTLALWAAGALLLCRAPVWFQRKLLFGLGVPLALLAAAAKPRRSWLAGAAAASLLSWVYVVANTRLSLSIVPGEYYVSDDTAAAIRFIASRGSTDDVVFSTVDQAGVVPMLSGRSVVWGHWAQGVDYDAVKALYGRLEKGRGEKELWRTADYVLATGALKEELDSGKLRWLKSRARLLFSTPTADVYGAGPS